jgi:hypothetical protein
VYPLQPKSPSPDERMELFLSEALLRRIGKQADNEIAKQGMSPMSDTKSTDSKRSTPRRGGGKESYHVCRNIVTKIDRLASTRGYKVLTFTEDGQGRRVVFDICTGTIYQAGSRSKISFGAVLFDTEVGALGEKFSPRPVTYSFSYRYYLLLLVTAPLVRGERANC